MDYTYFRLFLPIFRLFSAYFPPIFCLWYPILIINSSMLPICCFSAHVFTDSAYFPPKIPPIFRRSCLAGNEANSINSFHFTQCITNLLFHIIYVPSILNWSQVYLLYWYIHDIFTILTNQIDVFLACLIPISFGGNRSISYKMSLQLAGTGVCL